MSKVWVGRRKRLPHLLALFAATVLARGQSVDIYPEFRRVDPFGAVVTADRGITAREILSPAVARNAFASFHIAVSVPAKESYLLYVATNPPNACRVALYREHFTKTSQGWIPDALTEVRVAEARVPDIPATSRPPVLPTIEQGADAAAINALREYQSGVPPRVEP